MYIGHVQLFNNYLAIAYNYYPHACTTVCIVQTLSSMLYTLNALFKTF